MCDLFFSCFVALDQGSLEHQEGRRVFCERSKFSKLRPIVLKYVQHIFPGGQNFFSEALPPDYGPGSGVSNKRAACDSRGRFVWPTPAITHFFLQKTLIIFSFY